MAIRQVNLCPGNAKCMGERCNFQPCERGEQRERNRGNKKNPFRSRDIVQASGSRRTQNDLLEGNDHQRENWPQPTFRVASPHKGPICSDGEGKCVYHLQLKCFEKLSWFLDQKQRNRIGPARYNSGQGSVAGLVGRTGILSAKKGVFRHNRVRADKAAGGVASTHPPDRVDENCQPPQVWELGSCKWE